MARYLSEGDARADGYEIVHQPDQHRFALLNGDQELGVAHYTLLGSAEDGTAGIDFDHTVVDPSLRGTGLSGVLAHRALTDEIVTGRNVVASCWFIEGYLAKHPELLRENGE